MESFLKRKIDPNDTNETTSKKVAKERCPHAERCYRRNPHHFREFDHPHLTTFLETGEPLVLPDGYPQEKQVVVEQLQILKSLTKPASNLFINKPQNNGLQASTSSSQNSNYKKLEKTTSFVPNSVPSSTTTSGLTMMQKVKLAEPYNLFFTRIPESPQTIKENNSISITDLLCPSLGELKRSLQINFMIDIMWLMEQYDAQGVGKKPLTVVYGYEFPNMKEYMDRKLPNVTHHLVNMKDPFGTHHSKIGCYLYADGSLRVVVSTANLYYEDWNRYNQGLWLSPSCPRLPDSSPDNEGSGPTNFKTSLLTYLKSYNIPCLKDWIEHVKRADFSAVKVFLITSTPGKHYPKDTGCHCHVLADLLSKHCTLPAKTTPESEGPLSWSIIAQASSIGSLGKTAGEWLRSVLLRSLSAHKQGQLTRNSNATLNVIFPSRNNVMNSYYGAEGGGCLPYSKTVHLKQKWFNEYLHQWKADHTHRSKAMPHIKTYCRVSPCTSKIAWFLITSANISKSAWGGNIQKDSAIYVRSYEVGVLFLPKLFEEDYFQIKDFSNDGKKLFPFIYDIPLTSYKTSDEPWCN